MDISNQFQEIRIFLTQNGFVTVLKKISMPAMPKIVGHCVTGQKPAHYGGN
jgi:hypothetical protein